MGKCQEKKSYHVRALSDKEKAQIKKDKRKRERMQRVQARAIVDGYIYSSVNDINWAGKICS